MADWASVLYVKSNEFSAHGLMGISADVVRVAVQVQQGRRAMGNPNG